MKATVIGGAGFIGSNLTRRLVALGFEVTVIDNLSSGKVEFIPEGVSFHNRDIKEIQGGSWLRSVTCGDVSSLAVDIPEDTDYIFHLAAQFANQLSCENPVEDAKTNILGTIEVLEAARTLKKLKKLIYVSSSCVYGRRQYMREEDKVDPHETPYAITKYAGELYMKCYSSLYNVPTVSIRVFNTYGPWEEAGEYRNVIPRFIENALRGTELLITGTGEETRDFTFVSDTIDLLLLAAESSYSNAEIFNSGTGTAVAIKDLVKMVLEKTSSKSDVVIRNPRFWDKVPHRMSSLDKSRELLGYNPSVGLSEGLDLTLDWYRDRV